MKICLRLAPRQLVDVRVREDNCPRFACFVPMLYPQGYCCATRERRGCPEGNDEPLVDDNPRRYWKRGGAWEEGSR